MTFQKGQSGNPAGKAPGRRNNVTVAIEEMLSDSAEELAQKLVEKAKEGDMTAIKCALDRLSPPRRDQAIRIRMPELGSAEDAKSHDRDCVSRRRRRIDARRRRQPYKIGRKFRADHGEGRPRC